MKSLDLGGVIVFAAESTSYPLYGVYVMLTMHTRHIFSAYICDLGPFKMDIVGLCCQHNRELCDIVVLALFDHPQMILAPILAILVIYNSSTIGKYLLGISASHTMNGPALSVTHMIAPGVPGCSKIGEANTIFVVYVLLVTVETGEDYMIFCDCDLIYWLQKSCS